MTDAVSTCHAARQRRGCRRHRALLGLVALTFVLQWGTSPAHAQAEPTAAPACEPLTAAVQVGSSIDLSDRLCVPGTDPEVVAATGPGRFAGTSFQAGTTALGTWAATLRWTQPAAEQSITITVQRARPGLAIGRTRCSAAGTCRLRLHVRQTPVRDAVLHVERRTDGRWRSYERLVAARSTTATVRVAAGRYRAQLRARGGTLQEAGASNVVSWTQKPIRGRSGGTWPVAPVAEQHAIRASFMDARPTNYHHGVDIFIDDREPEPGAPSWASHRVYAARGGVASYISRHPTVGPARCSENRVAIGSHIYYHVAPTVFAGQTVMRGQQIGWSCRGRWHVHLTDGFGTNPRNPVRPGAGILAPYLDDTSPTVEQLSAWTPCDGRWRPWSASRRVPVTEGIPPCGRRLSTQRLRGLVDVRFIAMDEGPRFTDVDRNPRLAAPMQPYRAAVVVDRLTDAGRVARRVLEQQVFRADSLAGQDPFTVHWAPGFRRWLPLWQCSRMRTGSCAGAYWHRAFGAHGNQRYWDTRRVPNGRYRITVRAWDVLGNQGTDRIDVRVMNGARSRGRDTVVEQPDPAGGPLQPRGSFLDAESERSIELEAQARFAGRGAQPMVMSSPE